MKSVVGVGRAVLLQYYGLINPEEICITQKALLTYI